ncbi:MAG: hypothetical protein AB1768_09480 [Pseudomonadota bacterium]|jgi:hypothetical protein
MFKRPLHLLFVCPEPELARLALELTGRLAAGRIEARAAPSADADWPDLVLLLETGAPPALPPLPGRIQVRRVPLKEDDARAVLEARIRGIAGGLALLARSDQGD